MSPACVNALKDARYGDTRAPRISLALIRTTNCASFVVE
jgi:hypothetical protein